MTTNAHSSTDDITDGILSRLKRLPPKHSALFAACVAERFSECYFPFVQKYDHADPLLVRQAIDAIWQYLQENRSLLDLRNHLARLELHMPAAERLDSLESVLAQNVCIVVDSAVRSCLRERDGEFVAGQFAIELLRVAITNGETGLIDFGSGEGSKEFEKKLAHHPLIATEIELQRADLASLEATSFVSSELVTKLRNSAERKHVDVSSVVE